MADKKMPAFMKGKKGKAGKKPMMNKGMMAKGGKEMPAPNDPMGKKAKPFGSSRY